MWQIVQIQKAGALHSDTPADNPINNLLQIYTINL